MALTVKETKAKSRPASGYPITFPTVPAHPLGVNTSVRRPSLTTGMRQTFQMRGQRGSIARPAPDRFGSRPRTIL